MLSPCGPVPPGKVCNPETGRLIKEDGAAARDLRRRGVLPPLGQPQRVSLPRAPVPRAPVPRPPVPMMGPRAPVAERSPKRSLAPIGPKASLPKPPTPDRAYKAILEDDLDAIKGFLNNGLNIEHVFKLTQSRRKKPLIFTLLNEAALWNRTKIVKELLKRGANIKNNNSLSRAVRGSVKHLDDLGIFDHLSYKNPYSTVRHNDKTVKLHNYQTVNALLEAGANPNGFKGDIAPIFCVRYIDTLNALIAHGVDLNVKLHIDKNENDDEAFEGATPLHVAVSPFYGDPEEIIADIDVVKELLKQGLSLEAKTDTKETPLHCLVRSINPSPNIVKELLSQGADPNAKDELYNSPIIFALMNQTCSDEIIKLLIDFRANIHTHYDEGATALHWAVIMNRLDAVILLLFRGAGPDVQDAFGRSALMIAINNKNEDMVKTLLDHGADPKIKDSDDKSSIWHAKSVELSKDLINRMTKLDPEKQRKKCQKMKVKCPEGSRDNEPISMDEWCDISYDEYVKNDDHFTQCYALPNLIKSFTAGLESIKNGAPLPQWPIDPFSRKPIPPNVLIGLYNRAGNIDQPMKLSFHVLIEGIQEGKFNIDEAMKGQYIGGRINPKYMDGFVTPFMDAFDAVGVWEDDWDED